MKRKVYCSSFLRQFFTVKGSKWSPPTIVEVVEAANDSSGRATNTGVIVCALPLYPSNTLAVGCWIISKHFICSWLTSFNAHCFVHVQCLRADCSYVRFERVIQLHDCSNVAIGVFGFCLINAPCTYSNVCTSRLKLQSHSHWITTFSCLFYSLCNEEWWRFLLYSLHLKQRLVSHVLAIYLPVFSTWLAQWLLISP